MNPIVKLSEIVQSQYGDSIKTKVIGKTGPDHVPTIKVSIELPNGNIYLAEGSNKKIAKQKAAELALADLIK